MALARSMVGRRSRLATLSSSLARGALVVALAQTGCASSPSPYMHASPRSVVQLRDGEAAVVFVRLGHACDTADWFTLMDERGAYVGDSLAESHFTIAVPAGDHSFFAWDPFFEPHVVGQPPSNQVAAVRGQFEAGQTYFVEVAIGDSPFGMRHTCSRFPHIRLKRLAPSDVGSALMDTSAYVPDRAAGAAALASDPAEASRHLAQGMARLDPQPIPPPP